MTVPRSVTRANYDRLSRWYDLLAGSSERRWRDLGLHMLAVQPGERVLEIGAGTGSALLALAGAAGPAGRACGVDLSPGMCRVSHARAARANGATRPVVLCGDAVTLPFRAGSFDAAFMSFALELFAGEDMGRVLAECRRVLAGGGRLAVVAMAEREPRNRMARLYGWAHRRFPAWVDCRPIPLAHVLATHGFGVEAVTHGSLWGLPVAAATASRGAAR